MAEQERSRAELHSVCVFLGSQVGADPQFVQAAQELGRGLAQAGVAVVYGGARIGCMGALADAALQAGGEVIGVMPQRLIDREVAHAGLSDFEVVQSMAERKARMHELCDAYVVLPGGYGTLDELFEVLTARQLGEHQHRVVVVDVAGYWRPLAEQLQRMGQQGFSRAEFLAFVEWAGDVPAALALLSAAPAEGGA